MAFLGLGLFGAASVGKCALPWCRMYALVSLRLCFFYVAGMGQCALPGIGCRPRGVSWAPHFLRGRCGGMCIVTWSGSFMYSRTNTVRHTRTNSLTYSRNPFVNPSLTFFLPTPLTHSLYLSTHTNSPTYMSCPPITFVLPVPFALFLLSLSLKKFVILYGYRFIFADPSRRTRTTQGPTKGFPRRTWPGSRSISPSSGSDGAALNGSKLGIPIDGWYMVNTRHTPNLSCLWWLENVLCDFPYFQSVQKTTQLWFR